jgi:hypothetical protein
MTYIDCLILNLLRENLLVDIVTLKISFVIHAQCIDAIFFTASSNARARS